MNRTKKKIDFHPLPSYHSIVPKLFAVVTYFFYNSIISILPSQYFDIIFHFDKLQIYVILYNNFLYIYIYRNRSAQITYTIFYIPI